MASTHTCEENKQEQEQVRGAAGSRHWKPLWSRNRIPIPIRARSGLVNLSRGQPAENWSDARALGSSLNLKLTLTRRLELGLRDSRQLTSNWARWGAAASRAPFTCCILCRILLIEFQCQQYFGLLCYYQRTALHSTSLPLSHGNWGELSFGICVIPGPHIIKFTPLGAGEGGGAIGNYVVMRCGNYNLRPG